MSSIHTNLRGTALACAAAARCASRSWIAAPAARRRACSLSSSATTRAAASTSTRPAAWERPYCQQSPDHLPYAVVETLSGLTLTLQPSVICADTTSLGKDRPQTMLISLKKGCRPCGDPCRSHTLTFPRRRPRAARSAALHTAPAGSRIPPARCAAPCGARRRPSSCAFFRRRTCIHR
jgi:hypothetical protein